MLNKKLFTVGCAAGSMALFSLIACSSDSSSDKMTGATIDPDAIARNFSSSSNPGSSADNFDFPEIAFKTAATSVVALDGGELKTFEAENGASAECTGDEKSYISKIQIDADGVVKNSLELKNFGSGCDSVLAEFVASCHSQAVVYNGKDDKESCDENGNVKSYCYDDRAVTTIPADSTVNFNDIVRNLSTFSEELCNDVYKDAKIKMGIFSTLSSSSHDESSSSIEPPDPDMDTLNVIVIPWDTTPIDTAAFTLDKYTAQFTDDPSELSFDEHVLAYNGGLPSTAYLDEDIEQNRSGINPILKEINVSDIGNYFPMTAAIVGNRTPKENCKTFLVLSHDGAQPTGHVLSKISKGSIEISSVYPGGPCMQTAMYFPIAFLVEDCDGLLDENTEFSYNRFTSKTWACETLGSPTKKAVAYGEWYRADLIK